MLCYSNQEALRDLQDEEERYDDWRADMELHKRRVAGIALIPSGQNETEYLRVGYIRVNDSGWFDDCERISFTIVEGSAVLLFQWGVTCSTAPPPNGRQVEQSAFPRNTIQMQTLFPVHLQQSSPEFIVSNKSGKPLWRLKGIQPPRRSRTTRV